MFTFDQRTDEALEAIRGVANWEHARGNFQNYIGDIVSDAMVIIQHKGGDFLWGVGVSGSHIVMLDRHNTHQALLSLTNSYGGSTLRWYAWDGNFHEMLGLSHGLLYLGDMAAAEQYHMSRVGRQQLAQQYQQSHRDQIAAVLPKLLQVGDRFTFRTPFEQYSNRNEQRATVRGIISEPDDTHDIEVLPMYRIQFDDDFAIEAWTEEVKES